MDSSKPFIGKCSICYDETLFILEQEWDFYRDRNEAFKGGKHSSADETHLSQGICITSYPTYGLFLMKYSLWKKGLCVNFWVILNLNVTPDNLEDGGEVAGQ